MPNFNFDRPLTVKDVEAINNDEHSVCYVYLKSTKNQDVEVFSKIKKECYITVLPDGFEQHKSIMDTKSAGYPVEVFCKILTFFDKLDKEIMPSWSDKQKALYIYRELQKLPEDLKAELSGIYDLSAIATKNANSQGLSAILHEALSRQNIHSRFMFNDKLEAWNEVKIGDTYYPVDLYRDTNKYMEQSKQYHGDAAPSIDNFANEGFYSSEEHTPNAQAELISRSELEKPRFFRREELEPNPSKKEEVVDKKQITPVVIERKDIKLKSKELANFFGNGEITKDKFEKKPEIKPEPESGEQAVEEVDERVKLTIDITDSRFDDLLEDIEQIGTYYPEILDTVEIKNESGFHVDFQKVIDKVYEAKKADVRSIVESSKVRIISTNPEDFNLDFSAAPKVDYVPELYDNDDLPGQSIEFINPDENTPIKLPDLKAPLPESITGLTFKNVNFDGVSVNFTNSRGVRDFSISGAGTQNINGIPNIDRAHRVLIDGVSDREFDEFMNNTYTACTVLDKFSIANQRLKDREIFRELALNPNVAMFDIEKSRLNTLEGIDDLDGRIATCDLQGNELGLSAIKKMEELKERNPVLLYSLINDKEILNGINNMQAISEDTRKFIAEYLLGSGIVNAYLNKTQATNWLTYERWRGVPIYAKDAKIVRTELGLKRVPMMIKEDSEFNTIDFNSPDMQDGVMLLTIPQIEFLLNSGKTIPQSIRIKIEDVTQLDIPTLEDLENRMSAKGMTLTAVQMFDKDNNNNENMIAPHTVENYKKIRQSLERLIEGIDPAEPDIDKFITVYMRLTESVPYDHSVCASNPNMGVSGALRFAEYIDKGRNVEEIALEGTGVCSAYSDVLNNALKMLGMEVRTNSGKTKRVDGGGHAWNQVKIDGKWYYADATWDEKKSSSDPKNRDYNWALLGRSEFVRHEVTHTKKIEPVEFRRYPEDKLKEAIRRNEHRSFDFTVPDIVIEQSPTVDLSIDEDSIKDEYKRRRDDMLAKYYGDKDYQREYQERSARFRSNERDITQGGVSYRTIVDYPEREEDEKFLFLDGYKDALERSTQYQAGNTNIYDSYPDPDAKRIEDIEYVRTRNHTFNQHASTNRDLATLGKYGERVPYIPPRQGVLRNVGRAIANTGIFIRNITAPAYRFVGRFVGQPLHRLITRNSDASPYRNNFYHRMVARRDYFAQDAANNNPSHPIRNALSSRFKAVFSVKEGNKAVLRAGLANIKQNIREQEGQRIAIDAYQNQIAEIRAQITRLESQINMYPNARNIMEAQDELDRKRDELTQAQNNLDRVQEEGIIRSKQTDAIDEKQHNVASKEVNTLRVTAIKGIAKGAALKFLGPKLKDLILEHTQKAQQVTDVTTRTNITRRWVEPTYKQKVQEVYEDVLDRSGSLHEMMAGNKGNKVTGFYSVYGGERRPALYELTGDEKITAIFQSVQNKGHGLSDTVGLKAPRLTDGTFSQDMLTESGLLNQDISLDKLVSSLSANGLELKDAQDLYVSVDDRCWVKLSDLMSGLVKSKKVDEIVTSVVDQPGHFETIEKVVNVGETATKMVNNPVVEKGADVTGKILTGLIAADTLGDVNENLRRTRANGETNPKDYDFDDEEAQNLPTSRKDYRDER